MATVDPTIVSELCSGRRPQNVVLCRGIARPDLFYAENELTKIGDKAWSIPEHVPVFTTEAAMKRFMDPGSGSKRSRDDADANLIPIIAHLPHTNDGADPTIAIIDEGQIMKSDGTAGEKLIFVGVSYGEASRSRPTVSIAMGGLMPMVQSPATNLKAGKPAWWDKKAYAYGRGKTPITIAVLTTTGANVSDAIDKPDVGAFCGVSVLQSTQDDIAVLLGVPPQKAPTA